MNKTIPLIDIAPLMENRPPSQSDVVQAIDDALRNVGFFTIVGHGVSQALIRRLRDQSYEFFNLPMGKKMKVKSVGY